MRLCSFRAARRLVHICCVWTTIFAFLFAYQAQFALANPVAGSVVAGSASINSAGSTVTVTQQSNRAIINWGGFSIGAGETTQFVQPGANAAILNRVTGGNPSAILGSMQSNGQVYLINPAGIVFGPNANVNVGGLVASTLNVANDQFMQNADLTFSGDSTAGIYNYGNIEALEGNIYMFASNVANHGVLRASQGRVGMLATDSVTLVDGARPYLPVTANSRSISETGVTNTGLIEALRVELAANGGNVYALAINNEGTIRATGSEERGGEIYLVANGGKIRSTGDLIAKKGVNGGNVLIHAGGQDGSEIEVRGTIDVSGEEQGGSVGMKAAAVLLGGSNIDVSGGVQNGAMLISLGTSSAEIVPPKGGNFLDYSGPQPTDFEITDNDNTITTSNDELLKVQGGTIKTVSGNSFTDLMFASADANEFIGFITFNLDAQTGMGAPTIEPNATITFEVVLKKPAGPDQTVTLEANWADISSSGKIAIQATGGDLIKKVTFNSDNNGPDSNGVPFINGVKQIADVELATGSIIIEKVVSGGDSTQDFQFLVTSDTTELPGGVSFLEYFLKGGENTSANLLAGTYEVEETVPNGWFLESIMITGDADGGSPAPDVDLATATIDLDDGEVITVTFTNSQGGRIIIEKQTNPSGSLQEFDFTFTDPGVPTVTEFQLADDGTRTFSGLFPDTYTVEELLGAANGQPTDLGVELPDWDFNTVEVFVNDVSQGTDTSALQSVDLLAGQEVRLVYTNWQRGQILVEKIAIGLAGDSSSFDFNVSGTGVDTDFSLLGGQTSDLTNVPYLKPGDYTVAEIVANLPDNWDFNQVTIDGGAPLSDPSQLVTIQPGQTVNLAYTNTQRGQILVEKIAIGLAGDSSSFDFNVSGTGVDTDFSLLGGQTSDLTNVPYLKPGDYTVAEIVANLPDNWDFNQVTIDGGAPLSDPSQLVTIQPGQTVNLAYTNTQRGQILVEKIAIGLAGDSSSFDFNVSGTGVDTDFSLLGGQTSDLTNVPYLKPGDYTVAEIVANLPDNWDFNQVTIDGGAPLSDPSQLVTIQPGQTVNLAYTNTQRGQILVEKIAIGLAGDSSSFDFNVSGTGVDTDFSLLGGQTSDLTNVPYLKPGDYTVAEIVANLPDNWDFNQVTIDGGAPLSDPSQLVTIQPGQTVNLAYTNTQRGQILVEKIAIGLAGDSSSFDFNVSGTGVDTDFSLLGGQTSDLTNVPYLKPGDYTVAEIVANLPDNWDFNQVTIDGGAPLSDPSQLVTIQPGQTVNLAYTNTQRGQILVEKIAIGLAGDSSSFDFNVSGTGVDTDFSLLGGQTSDLTNVPYLKPGDYTVAEIVANLPDNWDFNQVTIDGGAPLSDPSQLVTIQPGQTVNLAYTNTQRGQILVEKIAIGLAGDSSSFDFNVSGTGVDTDFSLLGGQTSDLTNVPYLKPGDYTVAEIVANLPDNWDFNQVTIDGGAPLSDPSQLVTIQPGQTVNLAYTNTQRGQILVEKIAIGLAGDSSSFDFNVSGTGVDTDFSLLGGQTSDLTNVPYLKPGDYTVAEIVANLPDNWDFNQVTIDGGAPLSDPSQLVTIQPGQTVNLAYTNTQRGQILVEKIAIGLAGDSSSFDFNVSGTGVDTDFSLLGGQTSDLTNVPYLKPGDYTVAEIVANLPDNWDFNQVTIDGGAPLSDPSQLVTIQPGQTVNLAYTNTQRGQILVEKIAIGLAGDSSSFDFNVSGTGVDTDFSLLGGQTSDLTNVPYLKPGDYTVAEIVANLPDNWDFNQVTIDGGAPLSDPSQLVTIQPGQTVNLAYTNTQRGQILVEKIAIGLAGDSSSFDFNVSGTGVDTDFSLLGGQTSDLTNVPYLKPGDYTVAEIVANLPDNWDFNQVTIDGGAPLSDPSQLVTIEPGQTVNLAYTNTQRGQILVEKIAIGLAGDSSSFDFNVSGTGVDTDFSLLGGQTSDLTNVPYLKPGDYTVAEIVANLPDNWDFNQVTIDGGAPLSDPSQLVTIQPGQTVNLAYTNTQRGQILVEKIAIGLAGDSSSFDFNVSGTGVDTDFSLLGGQTSDLTNVPYLKPGDYTVAEIVANLPDNWDFNQVTIDGGAPLSDPSQLVTIQPGQTVNLAYTNTQRGQILVEKIAIGLAGDSSSFDFNVSGTGVDTDFSLLGGQTSDLTNVPYLKPGDYTVAEIVANLPDNWDFNQVTIDGGAPLSDPSQLVTIQPGQTVNLAYTNTQRGQILVEKIAIGLAGDSSSFDFNVSGTGVDTDFSLLGGQTSDLTNVPYLKPGEFDVIEFVPEGWNLDNIMILGDNGNSIINLDEASAGVTVDPGENITVKFTNNRRLLPLLPEFLFWWYPYYPGGVGTGTSYYTPEDRNEDRELTGNSSFNLFQPR